MRNTHVTIDINYESMINVLTNIDISAMTRIAVFMPIIITAKYVKAEFELRGLAFLA